MNRFKGWGISVVLLCTLLACNTSEVRAVEGIGAAASFYYPSGVATDSVGNVYVADSGNSTIRKITPAGEVTTLAGAPRVIGHTDGTGAAARFDRPSVVASDSTGNVYVSDTSNNTIRKITPAGVVTTLAGTPGIRGHADGTGTMASFYSPSGVATDRAGNVYVADSNNHTIRKITPAGVVTTLAGTAGIRGHADGTGTVASFVYPKGIATDSTGNVYVSDTLNQTIRKITPSGVVTTLAGTDGLFGSTDGAGAAARFNSPSGIATDSVGNVYVADYGNSSIRKITPGGVVTTLASSFIFPDGVATDSAGSIYVANTGDGTIRKITQAGVVTILASTAGVPPINRQVQTIPEEVERYSRELDIINNNPSTSGGVEELLQLGREASHALIMPPKGSSEDVLESLSDETFHAVSLKMNGFIVNREETINVDPDTDFFLALAKRTDDQASVEFFEAYKKTDPYGWPVYINQQTDYSGCIRFGTMSLVDTFTLWDTYRKKHPTRYQKEVNKFIDDVESELVGGTCACEDHKSATLEFEAFIRAYPRSKIVTRLSERVNQIHQGKSDIREHCHSG